MATLSNADKQNLNAQQQADVLKAKQDWEAANAIGDTAAMEKAHAAAEAIRASAASGAYSGGAAGNAYVSQSNGGGNPYMTSSTANGNATLSGADNAYLNAAQQQQIADLKAEWAKANAANNQAAMDAAHAAAEAIRNSAGYSGGAGGTDYNRLAANAGGMTADQMRLWLEDYNATNYRAGAGWTNGYDTAMNVRSKANQIRQQMLANEQAQLNADAATKDYLHQQNVALAQLLNQYAGGVQSTYNPELGRWETLNPDVGYGTDINHTYANIYNSMKDYMGYTDEDIQRFANDTSYYYNFVDPTLNRLAIDESRGYTGKYSQFANGPYLQLLRGSDPSVTNPSIYQDVFGDGFGNERPLANFTPVRDENGNVLNAQLPALKNNNAMTDYTNQFTSYVHGGVIQPGILAAANPGASGDAYGAYNHKTGGYVDASDPRYTGGINRDVSASTPDDPNNNRGQQEYYTKYGVNATNPDIYDTGNSGLSGLSGSGPYGNYLEQMYAAALQAQLEQLKDSYNQNISQLDASKGEVDDTYTEQKRQTTGTNAQQAANWRELANAYGLNSGAIGQAALAQNNQLQSNLNTLESAQAAAQAEIERQRTLLGQQYQSQINQALAENNYQMAQALYQEAVRQDELLLQQQQFNANLALQYAQLAQQQSQFDAEMALSAAKAMGSGSSGGSSGSVSASAGSGAGYIPVEGVDESEKYYQLYRDAYNQPNPQNYISSNYKKYGLTSSSGLSGQYDDWAKQELNYAALSDRIYNTPSLSNEEQFTMMRDAWQKGYIGDDQYNRFLNYTNVDLNRINGV